MNVRIGENLICCSGAREILSAWDGLALEGFGLCFRGQGGLPGGILPLYGGI